ncbi:VIT domain-containing protein [Caulobacter sp. KR2-114]|uniref:VIT domain-containing protein n=1 Tax=Caulobacter sp. KR2-114 TaxID=3400912 RepID=UPI003C01109E
MAKTARSLRAGLLASAMLLAAGWAGAGHAASVTLNPELVSRNYFGPNGAEPTHALTLGQMDVTVEIAGGVARTTVLAHFDNPTNAAVEGDFTLDLPPGAVVTGYALDINGALVEGVLAGQRQATLAYQRRVRRGVDPGVAEVTRDNAFRTHVFPIWPGRGRTVRLTFVAPIPDDGQLVLPLATLDPVGAATLTVKSLDGPRPEVEGPDGLELKWRDGPEGPVAVAHAEHMPLHGALVVRQAPAADPVTLTRHRDGDGFFEIDARASAAPPTRQGGLVRIYWDRSVSRRQDDLVREQALVAAYVAAVRPDAVELVSFADDAPSVARFRGPTLSADLAAALRGQTYRGATALTGVLDAAGGRADACLLFSDGRITVDPYRAERAACPLFTISTAADADHGFLGVLARKSGAEHLDLATLGVDAALRRLTAPGPRVVGVNGDGQALDFTSLPTGPDRFRLVGRALGVRKVQVLLADGSRQEFDLDGLTAQPHDGPGALWAAERIAEVTATDRPDQDQALAMARRYGVAGAGAAFVVLETLQDYVDAGITPPEAAGKDIQDGYARRLAQHAAAEADKQSARLDEVIRAWEAEKAWWAAPHGERKLAPTPRRGHAIAPPAAALAVEMPRPPPPPSPPPPPAMSASAPPVQQPAAPRASGYARAEPSTNAADSLVVTAARRAPAPRNAPAAVSAGAPQAEESRQASAPESTPAEASSSDGGIQIAVQPWDPDRHYLRALKAAPAGDFWRVFDEQQARYGQSPAFYLDVAELLYRQGQPQAAASMARSALELDAADDATLMIVADRMMRYGETDRALWMYEKVLALEPDRPQPRRSLALALAARAEHGEPAAAQRADDLRALDLLNTVITRAWDADYDGFELIPLMEANRIAGRLEALGVRDIPLDRRLRARLDVDLRVTLEWFVDATDMDLWVDEPSGERAIYSNPHTAIGGRLSYDMRRGYGPEEYLLRRAPDGTYVIRVNTFATDRLNPNGAIVVRAHVFRDYGRPNEREETTEVELKPGESGTVVVGEVKVGAMKTGAASNRP